MSSSDKGYIGMGMEGPVASWYAKITFKDIGRHQTLAQELAGKLAPGSRVLEIAPGPCYLSIELARLGDFAITGLDISKSIVEIARKNAAARGAKDVHVQGFYVLHPPGWTGTTTAATTDDTFVPEVGRPAQISVPESDEVWRTLNSKYLTSVTEPSAFIVSWSCCLGIE
jgi:hypothetical protein